MTAAALLFAVLATLANVQARVVEPDTRIINGEIAKEGQYPFAVTLWSDVNNSPYIECGASIVSEYFVITAAHCVDDYDPTKGYLFIQAGVVDWQQTGDRYNVTTVVGHPNYDAEGDIAVLKVAGPIKFSKNVKAVKLPKQGAYLKGGEKVTAVGWGAIATNPAKYPTVLYKVDLTVTPYDECKQMYLNAPHPYDRDVLNATELCAGKSNGGVCYGDSGSGLVEGNTLVGIVSSGVPCGIGYPDLYTRVSSLVSWAEHQMKTHR